MMRASELDGRIEARRDAGSGLFVLRIKTAMASACHPGCFVNVKIPGCGEDPFLRRPFGVAWTEPDNDILELLIQVRGRGTRALSGLAAGTALSLLGPLGNGFPIDALSAYERVALIGGCDGVAPLLFLSDQLKKKAPELQVALYVGARTKDLLPEPDVCASRVSNIHFATDDGSAGFQGNVLALYDHHAGQEHPPGTKVVACACGPTPLLEALRAKAIQTGMPCHLSLEARMACGYGVCNGCVVKLKNGAWAKVCTDGPVFPAQDLAPLA